MAQRDILSTNLDSTTATEKLSEKNTKKNKKING